METQDDKKYQVKESGEIPSYWPGLLGELLLFTEISNMGERTGLKNKG